MSRSLYTEFSAAAEKQGRAEYNVWELGDKACTADITSFKDLTKELDKRLAAIILQVQSVNRSAPDHAIFIQALMYAKKQAGSLVLAGLQGVQDCTTVTATFKLLEGFEGLLERPLIAAELRVSHLRLLSAYAADLGAVIALFKANMARPLLPQNAAPYSGAIYWAHGLMDRVSGE